MDAVIDSLCRKMPIDKEEKEICRQILVRNLIDTFYSEHWTAIYRFDESYKGIGLFAALTPSSERKKILASSDWDISPGGDQPGLVEKFSSHFEYSRFGDEERIEPLVFTFHYQGPHLSPLPKISEDFYRFHNFWDDGSGKILYKIDNNGNKQEAARITKEEVQVKTIFLKEYQAARQMDLVLYFESDVSINWVTNYEKIASINLAKELKTSLSSYRYELFASNYMGSLYSRLHGKQIFESPPISDSNVYPYEQKKEETFIDFIAGEDPNGKEIMLSCNYHYLSGISYMCPIFFKQEVLNNYYNKPDEYEIKDGYVSRKNSWSLRIDNSLSNAVAVMLGDLGKQLPEQERFLWRSYNIVPPGSISDTFFQRHYRGEWIDSDAPHLVFKRTYFDFNSRWLKENGWPLFMPPEKHDEHIIEGLHTPIESQPEYEKQVQNLAKALIEFLNIKSIKNSLKSDSVEIADGLLSISVFSLWLKHKGYDRVQEDVSFLRELQNERSAATAHRKSSKYQPPSSLQRKMEDNFSLATRMLNGLSRYFNL